MTAISATAAAPPASTPGLDKTKLAAAAKQFEAIFVRQMLTEARKSSFGDSLLGSEAQNTFREMQDSKFADLAAERGVFGLARVIEQQIGASGAAPASRSGQKG